MEGAQRSTAGAERVAMETDEKRPGKKEAAALSGGHLCHVCGYQYPNPHPSAKLRRSHRKHCGKAPSAAAAPASVVVEEEVVAGMGVGGREERNAGHGTLRGGEGGGEGQGREASEADGGSALLGSAREVDDSVEVKEIAVHASPNGAEARHIANEFSENGLINCINSEKVSLDDTGVQVITSELSENGLVDCSSNSIEIVNEGNQTEFLVACTNGSQNKVAKHCSGVAVGHPAEREDSFDEYQDASPFLHQSDSEDVAAPKSELSLENKKSNTVSSETSVAANEVSLEKYGSCQDQFSSEPNMTDLSLDSMVGYNLENENLSLPGPEVSLKPGGPYECSVNIDSNYTHKLGCKSDKTSGRSELLGDSNASSLQETHPLISEPESQSTCCCMEPPTQDWTVENTSDVQLLVENSCQESSVCSTVGFQNGRPVTNVDGMPNSIAEDSCDELNLTFEDRSQPCIVQKIVSTTEENPSVQKTHGFTKEEVRSKQIDREVPMEDQFSTSQKHATLLVDQMSSVKNPFDLDDARNDDLFELPTGSCFLEAPNAVESRQQVDSTSLIVDQPSVSNQTRIAEAQHRHNSNECMLSASSATENGHAVGPEDAVSCSAELVKSIGLTDAPMDHGLQVDELHRSGIHFMPFQAVPVDLSTESTEDVSVLSTDAEENMHTENGIPMEMTALHSTGNIEMKQADNTTAWDIYAANIEEKKLTEETAEEMNGVQHPDYENKQAGGTKEASAVQSMENLPKNKQTEFTVTKEASAVQSMENPEENKQTELTVTKEMNVRFNADDVEKRQANETSAEKMNATGLTDKLEEKILAQDTRAKEKMVATQNTGNVEETKQPNGTVGQEGNNQNEEIGVTGARLNSGRVHVPLKVLLAEASVENKVARKPSAKERVLSFRRRVSKDDNSSAKSGSPARLPRKDIDKKSKVRKHPWMPFVCCHSVH